MPAKPLRKAQERENAIAPSVSQRLTVTLPLPPSTNRLWRNVNGRTLLSAQARDYHKHAGWEIKDAAMKLPWRTRPGQRYRFDLVLHFANRRATDIDNRAKALIDVAAAVLGFNDSQVDMLVICRGAVDKLAPRAELTISVL